jgi:hypothetical protein
MYPLHFKQFMRAQHRFNRKPTEAVLQRNRFMIRAKQPANNPPPRIVVANVLTAPALPPSLVG